MIIHRILPRLEPRRRRPHRAKGSPLRRAAVVKRSRGRWAVAPLSIGLLALALAAAPAPARAAPGLESMFQDNWLLLRDQSRLPQTLATLRGLGVQRLRISVTWSTVAPRAESWSRPPGFRADDPAAYGSAWAPYDRIVREAAAYGMGVNFDVMGGGPLWASGRPPQPSMLHVWRPSASEFGQFVRAVGTRYSGSYMPPDSSVPVPRVSFWSVWNEPNVGSSSLSPQTARGIEVGPSLYRSLLGAAWTALGATGHGRDTILVGELASTGHADPGATLGMQPLRFLRALFCVDSGYRPLQGRAASVRGCPASGSPAAFRAANPALFEATAWSHHPYELDMAPNAPIPPGFPDWVTLVDLPRLERALDAAQRAYGSHRTLSIYLTEYGFETNPPRPDFAITPEQQAAYLNEAEYMAWRAPRVVALSQYLLRDAPGINGHAVSSFASGLEFVGGIRKPSFAAYRLPIWVPDPSGKSIMVWGCARPVHSLARGDVPPVEFQLDGREVARLALTRSNCYVDANLAIPHRGTLRLAWKDPRGGMIYSRQVSVQGGGGAQSYMTIVILAAAGFLIGATVALIRRGSRARSPR